MKRSPAAYKRIIKQAKSNGCTICGIKDDVLTFHHVNPEEKLANVTDLSFTPINILLLELNKCVPLCIPCHQTVHGARPYQKKEKRLKKWS